MIVIFAYRFQSTKILFISTLAIVVPSLVSSHATIRYLSPLPILSITLFTLQQYQKHFHALMLLLFLEGYFRLTECKYIQKANFLCRKKRAEHKGEEKKHIRTVIIVEIFITKVYFSTSKKSEREKRRERNAFRRKKNSRVKLVCLHLMFWQIWILNVIFARHSLVFSKVLPTLTLFFHLLYALLFFFFC